MVDLDAVWVANLVAELDPLLPDDVRAATVNSHCTDLYSHDANGGAIHGHNEDWSVEMQPLWYYLSLTAAPDATDFVSCAGLTYPGSQIAYAPAWNAEGIFQTQNTLFPSTTRDDGGLACNFVQRAALCSASTTSLEAYLAKLNTSDWAAGASLNVVDTNTGSMANAEVLLNGFDVYMVAPSSNYSHMNMFKHLQGTHTTHTPPRPRLTTSPPHHHHQPQPPPKEGIAADLGEPSTVHRQARIDELPAPTSTDDIAAILGDDDDSAYPIYRDITLTTSTLDATSGVLRVWAGHNPAETEPDFVWNIREWWP